MMQESLRQNRNGGRHAGHREWNSLDEKKILQSSRVNRQQKYVHYDPLLCRLKACPQQAIVRTLFSMQKAELVTRF
jgi:hypothetical protein